MMTKAESIQRLCELGDILGREPDTSGSAADIAQRVAEWEEELAASGETPFVENETETSPEGDDRSLNARGEWVLIRALRTLHTDALQPDNDGYTGLVLKGTCARVLRSRLSALVNGGLAEAVGE
ncbi:TPA: DNA packaging protein [Escherichia coli]|nr:DNA packaging protein [Escherichia coli]HEL7988076.1 DNA packaging protein [Escherichia coli]HEL8021145.1 DNA packaging protein [Escherichia coli]HEL8068308.1 DNA packaging protein [Escherichia coli]HEL8087560.1 DNA packaging protein [Escherichia coli]